MANRIRHFIPIVLFASLAAAPGCAANGWLQEAQKQQNQGQQGQSWPGSADPAQTPAEARKLQVGSLPEGMQALGTDNAVIRMRVIDNTKYVPLRELADVLQFTTVWEAKTQTFRMGDNDAPYAVTMNSRQAVKNGDAIALPAAPRLEGGAAYLPASAVADLFREDMSYEIRDDRLIVRPSNVKIPADMNASDPEQADEGLSFGDDPNDPFKGSLPETEMPVSARIVRDAGAAAAVKNLDMNALVRTGMRYLGVKYEFGADPYPKSGRFDCSSYMQYVFGKSGAALPRLARQQAQRGTAVSRTSLRKGDLLFFCVPGRYKSNRTVGHVGIYVGGHRMLHAGPKPTDGVQMTNLDTDYWKETFLFAKRITY
jgi:cell wall-associated NlpC family hydrolase